MHAGHFTVEATARRQYYFYNALYNFGRAAYTSTYSLFLVDVLAIDAALVPWLLVLNLLFTMAGEIPTGVVADLFGRRKSFLAAVLITSVGYGTYALAPFASGGAARFATAACAEVMLAIGYTFYSGSLEAWIVDLHGQADAGTLRRIFSRAQAIKNVFYVVGGVAGAALYFAADSVAAGQAAGVGATFTLALCAGIVLIAHAGPLMVRDDGRPTAARAGERAGIHTYWRHTRQSMETATSDRRLLVLMLLTALAFLSLQLLVFFWPYFLVRQSIIAGEGRAAQAWGIALSWVLAYGARTTGNSIAGLPLATRRPAAVFVGATALAALPILALGMLPAGGGGHPGVWTAACLLAYALVRFGEGIADPLRQVFLNLLIPAPQRSTLLSINSSVSMVVSSLGLVAASAALGAGATVVDVWGAVAVMLVVSSPLYAFALSKTEVKHGT